MDAEKMWIESWCSDQYLFNFHAKLRILYQQKSFFILKWKIQFRWEVPDSKVHGANMGPTWVLSAPDGPHLGPMNLAVRDLLRYYTGIIVQTPNYWPFVLGSLNSPEAGSIKQKVSSCHDVVMDVAAVSVHRASSNVNKQRQPEGSSFSLLIPQSTSVFIFD